MTFLLFLLLYHILVDTIVVYAIIVEAILSDVNMIAGKSLYS